MGLQQRSLVAFHGPRFYSGSAFPGAAMGVLNGRIVGFATVEEWRRRGAELIEVPGALAIPGLNDAHIHPLIAARNATTVDVSPASVGSRSALEERIRETAQRIPAGQWLRFSRYDPSSFRDGTPLLRRDLDRIAPDHPVILVHTACHWGVTNSKGLDLGGLRTPDDAPDGGFLGVDEHGDLDGVIYEQALFDYDVPAAARRVETVIPSPSDEQLRAGMREFLHTLNALGVTSVTDALCDPTGLGLYQSLNASGELTARVNTLIGAQYLEQYEAAGIRDGFGDDRVRIGGFKAFVDGAVAGRTCLMSEPFEGSDDRGLQVMTSDELQDLAFLARRSENRLAVHANGDEAIRLLVDALSADRAAHGPNGVRHRIEHCSMPDEKTIQRIADLDLIVVPFGSYAWYHGEKVLEWYGTERAEHMFPHRSFLEHGVTVAGSSDFPCGPFEPMAGIMSCVLRQGQGGEAVGPSQRISLPDALNIYTGGSSAASGEEASKGRLEPGMLADFAVFGEDLETVPVERLTEISVESTWVGGACVWSREDSPQSVIGW